MMDASVGCETGCEDTPCRTGEGGSPAVPGTNVVTTCKAFVGLPESACGGSYQGGYDAAYKMHYDFGSYYGGYKYGYYWGYKYASDKYYDYGFDEARLQYYDFGSYAGGYDKGYEAGVAKSPTSDAQ